MHDMPMAQHQAGGGGSAPWVWLPVLLCLLLLYQAAALSPRHKTIWPWWRSFLWTAGLIVAGAGVIGPVADRTHSDLRWHMAAHLCVGMIAPVLLVMAAPVTLVLRALPRDAARGVARLLASRPVWLIAHPITAAILDVGGLWLLYLTPLYTAMHEHVWLGVLVHLHLLFAGYLFTAAIIGIDPIRHRPGWSTRVAVLVLAMAAHAILAKSLYAHPPIDIDATQAHAAGRMMYYGGDAVELVIAAIFCRQWYRWGAGGRRPINDGARPAERAQAA
jgi:putative membrane protein